MAAGVAIVGLGVAALSAHGSRVDDNGCPAIHQQATALVAAGDRAAGAALPLQGTDMARYHAEENKALDIELRGFRLVSAHRECFSDAELTGVDPQIKHLETRLHG